MIRLDIEKDNLEFKNLLSGPAPIGRILNYIHLAGTTGMFHQNGYRYLDFKDKIGYAWTTEYIIGLGLFVLGKENGSKFHLDLTDKGIELFNIMNEGKYIVFDEGTSDSSLKTVIKQMNNCSELLYPTFKRIFVESYPYRILKMYLEENGYHYQDKSKFMDDLFEAVKDQYDKTPNTYNRTARTPTGQNRVPSLIQMCLVFDFLDQSEGIYTFDKDAFENAESNCHSYSAQELQKAASDANLLIVDAQALADKYGIDGTVLSETVVRNSTLQHIFKTNLMLTQHEQCILCGLDCKELLIGSHIKPAVESNAKEKADHNNGLLLCCNHDRLFDRYLITFDSQTGRIEVSKNVSESDRLLLGLEPDFKLPQDVLTPERQKYLSEHNSVFISKEKERSL